MNLLITGASGFIGSYVTDYFLKHGHTVIAAARNSDRIIQNQNGNLIPVQNDILDVASFDRIPEMSIDAVIHTATSNDIVSKNTIDGILLSAVGTKNVLEFCDRRRIPRIIFFSTFQVYGTELNGVITEGTPVHSQNDYGLNHLFGEQYVEMYSREKNLSGIVVRPSNVYGRFMSPFIERWTLVPGCFCKEIFNTGQITLQSSGKQMRNFVSLQEVSACLDIILTTAMDKYAIYNIASENNFTMIQVAGIVKDLFEKRYNKAATIKVLSEHPRTGNSFKVNLEKMYSLGYQFNNTHSLETEIDQLFNHLEKHSYEPNRTI